MGLRLERSPIMNLFGGMKAIIKGLILFEVVHQSFVEGRAFDGEIGDVAQDQQSDRSVEGGEVLSHSDVEGWIVFVTTFGSFVEISIISLAFAHILNITHLCYSRPLAIFFADVSCCQWGISTITIRCINENTFFKIQNR